MNLKKRHGVRRRFYGSGMKSSASLLFLLGAAVVLFGGEIIRPGERLGLVASSTPPPSDGTKFATASDGDDRTKSKVLPKQLVIQVPTQMRKAPVPATVALPSTYEMNPDRFYSVLFLLHGATDDYKSWQRIVDVGSLSDRYDMIIVSPDGGKTSWWLDSPILPEYQYETFVSTELIAYIDANYRTKKHSQRRALLGNSMGGHGAFYLAIRHPDVFGTAVALSGGVDIRPFPKQWDIAKRLGPVEQFPGRWEEHSVITQVGEKLTKDNLHLSLDCGIDDFFLNVNRALHEKMLAMKIEHDYAERPGGHSRAYWKKAIEYQMVFIDQHING